MNKWRRATPWVLALMANVCVAAGDIHVKKGETWRVTPDQASLNLDSLILEDGARIVFVPEVNLWQLSADVVRIGNNVVIDGSGVRGADGPPGKPTAPAKPCKNGDDGGNGGAGGLGEEGVTLVLSVGIQQIGSLSINTRGGEGGNGGTGTSGQNAGELDGCEITHGGEGGDGGRGGDGGNGGQVRLSVAVKGPNLSLDFVGQRIAIDSAGGKGGASGKGADGGAGSSGRWLSMKTLSGDRKYVAGGNSGKHGKEGSPGQNGRPGVIEIAEDVKQRVSAMIEAGSRQMETIAADVAGQKNAQLTQLLELVMQLQRNITALQSQVNTLQAQGNAQQTAYEAAKRDIEALKLQLNRPSATQSGVGSKP